MQIQKCMFLAIHIYAKIFSTGAEFLDICPSNCRSIQEQLVQYYDVYNCELIGNGKPFLTNKGQRENDKQKIRELFKQMLDIAAKATEEKNPEMSIMFDGIGLVRASDYVEAVSKIFSMFKTAIKSDNYFSGGCPGY